MKYYDLHDIIAEESKILAEFSVDKSIIAPFLTDEFINFFFINFLLENEHCSIVDPVNKLRNELLAKASIVNLNTISEEFYLLLVKLNDDDAFRIFSERIADFLNFIFSEDFNDDDQTNMDRKEKEIFRNARKKYLEYKNFHKIFVKE